MMMNETINSLTEAFSYAFIQRALISGCMIAVCCSSLGIFLVLRRFSLIGDGLAHFAIATIGLAFLFNIYPFYLMVPLVTLSSLLIYKLSEKHIFGDSAIGMVSSVGIAFGILFASLGDGFNVDLFSYLFGDILTVSNVELYGSILLSVLVILTIILFYQDFFAVTFDSEYSKVLGVKPKNIEKILLILTALTVVLGIKVVGTMLVSSLIIFPSVTSLQVAKGFREALILASIIGVTCVVLGIIVAFIFNLPAGATIVLFNFVFFMITFTVSRILKT